MTNKNDIRFKGSWDIGKTEQYLRETGFPLRFASLSKTGFPLVTSLWYLYDNGLIWCAVQNDSDIAVNISSDHRCGFEVGPNDTPYMGVRGQGTATLLPERGEEKLRKLIARFLDDKNRDLAQWLLSRSETETAIMIEPQWLFSWDFSDRMN